MGIVAHDSLVILGIGTLNLTFIGYKVWLNAEFGCNGLGTFSVTLDVLAGVLGLAIAPHIARIVFGRYINGTQRPHRTRFGTQSYPVGITNCDPVIVILYLTGLDLVVGHAEIVTVKTLLEQPRRAMPVCSDLQTIYLITKQLLVLIEGVVLGIAQTIERLMDINEHGTLFKAVTFLNLTTYIIEHLHHTGLIIRRTLKDVIDNLLLGRCHLKTSTLLVDSSSHLFNILTVALCI